MCVSLFLIEIFAMFGAQIFVQKYIRRFCARNFHFQIEILELRVIIWF